MEVVLVHCLQRLLINNIQHYAYVSLKSTSLAYDQGLLRIINDAVTKYFKTEFMGQPDRYFPYLNVSDLWNRIYPSYSQANVLQVTLLDVSGCVVLFNTNVWILTADCDEWVMLGAGVNDGWRPIRNASMPDYCVHLCEAWYGPAGGNQESRYQWGWICAGWGQ